MNRRAYNCLDSRHWESFESLRQSTIDGANPNIQFDISHYRGARNTTVHPNQLNGDDDTRGAFFASLVPFNHFQLTSNDADICVICQESFRPTGQGEVEQIVRLPCGHVLGQDCAQAYFNSLSVANDGLHNMDDEFNDKCPHCRIECVYIQSGYQNKAERRWERASLKAMRIVNDLIRANSKTRINFFRSPALNIFLHNIDLLAYLRPYVLRDQRVTYYPHPDLELVREWMEMARDVMDYYSRQSGRVIELFADARSAYKNHCGRDMFAVNAYNDFHPDNYGLIQLDKWSCKQMLPSSLFRSLLHRYDFEDARFDPQDWMRGRDWNFLDGCISEPEFVAADEGTRADMKRSIIVSTHYTLFLATAMGAALKGYYYSLDI